MSGELSNVVHSPEWPPANVGYFQSLFLWHPLPSWIYNTATMAFLAVNRAAVAQYGYGEAEFLRMRITDILPPDDVPVLKEELRLDPALQESTGPWRHRRKDGVVLTVHVYAQDIEFQGGPARLVVVNDISERKRLEEDLRLFEAAVSGASEAMVITDANAEPSGSCMLFVNGAFTRMTGYSPEELTGKCLSVLYGPKTEIISRAQLLDGCEAHKPPVYQTVYYRKDRSEYQVEFQVTPLRDPSGALTHFLRVQRDVTERNRLQERLHQAQKMEAVGRLAGGIAHDFNNLLTIILGYGGLLAAEMTKAQLCDTKQLRSLNEIQKAAEKAAALTGQLLAFSRKQVPRMCVIDVNAVVSNLESMLRRLLGEDIDLALRIDPKLGRVEADAGQLEQALMNLAVNARDAMPRGGMLTIETGNLEVTARYAAVSSVKSGSYAVISVTDTGYGMDADTRTRVFEPFFTTKEAGRGTGLGLPMVYAFVTQLGGFVRLYSEPDKGACFKLYLPRTDSALETEEAPAVSKLMRGSGLILVVEDEVGIRELTREVLTGAGYQVLIAENAKQAIDVARSHPGKIDLLFSDVVLPGASGPDVAIQLKALRPEMKVLFASGYSDHALLRQGALEQGAAFVQKPFDPDMLLTRISELLDHESSSHAR